MTLLASEGFLLCSLYDLGILFTDAFNGVIFFTGKVKEDWAGSGYTGQLVVCMFNVWMMIPIFLFPSLF
ncbi:hypothetical protein QBC45DRAFT_398523, partial [Copromyces sp. CBS 386.78]